MRKGCKYKSPEAAERERRHQFGQPEGNPTCDKSVAANQREFYRWVESIATQDELKAYIKKKDNPFGRVNFIKAFLKNTELDEMFAMTNQTHGAPKQPIEVQSLPKVECEVFGKE